MLKCFLIFFMLTVIASGCSVSSKEKKTSYEQITMEEVLDLMENEEDYVILDVRTEGEYKEGHIPGALNIPNETIGKEEIAALPDKTKKILVYCRSGSRSKQAAKKLADLGYENIYEFGGIIDWKGDIVTE